MTTPLPEPTVKWVLTSWRGRLGRRSYFWGAALLAVAQVYLFVAAAGLDSGVKSDMLALGLGAIFLWLASAWAILAMSVKRLHDIGFSAKLSVLVFIPVLSLLFLIAMMLIPGSQETNEHGPPPFKRHNK